MSAIDRRTRIDDIIAGLAIVLIIVAVVLAALGALDLDDTEQRSPIPVTVYQPREEEP